MNLNQFVMYLTIIYVDKMWIKINKYPDNYEDIVNIFGTRSGINPYVRFKNLIYYNNLFLNSFNKTLFNEKEKNKNI